MTIPNFYLNNTLVNPPRNWKELGLELNFDSDKNENKQRVTVTDFEFVNENSDLIRKWIADGNVFEGLPFRIELERNGVKELLFNGYLDLPQSTLFSKSKCEVRAVELENIDSLQDKVDSFTYQYLFDNGIITTNDFVSVPYVLNSVPNYLEVAVSTLAIYVMAKEIRDAVHKISELTASLANILDPTVIVRVILYVLYLILVIVALIKLLQSIIKLLIQPVKYHSAMSIKSQLEKGAEHLGYTFKSSIFDEAPYNDSYIIPQKYFNPTNSKDNQLLGFTSPSVEQLGFYKGTFGDLLRDCKNIFNAKIIVDGTDLILERNDYNLSTPQFIMPPVANNYDYRTDAFTLNTDEFNANYLISFLTDGIDKNTIQDYLGTSYQVITEPNTYINSNMKLMRGLKEVRIPFALAKTKTELTQPEELISAFLKILDKTVGALVKAVNTIIKLINKVISTINRVIKSLKKVGINISFQVPSIPTFNMPSFSQVIDNRIGMLKIENDIINVPKICVLTLGKSAKFNKLNTNNDTYFSAKYLYNNFHFIESFVPSTDLPNANQYYLKNYEKVPFTFNDYLKVKQNNVIFANNKECIIDSLEWNVWNQHANIKLRENLLYTTNLKESFLEPDGQ